MANNSKMQPANVIDLKKDGDELKAKKMLLDFSLKDQGLIEKKEDYFSKKDTKN